MNMAFPKMVLPKLSLPAFSSGRGDVGLVIRSREVQLVSFHGTKVLQHVRVPIPGKREDDLVQAISRAVAAAGLKTKRLAVAIPAEDVLVRSFTLPMIPKSEWESAVQFEVRKYIPFKPENLAWDYHVMPLNPSKPSEGATSARAGKLEAIFAGVPRETLRRFQESLTRAGLQPSVIEPVSLSLARLIAKAKDLAPEAFTCLVDIEPEQAHLVIARKGLPYLTRDVNLSAGVQTSGAEGANVEADGQVHRLLSELRVSLDFFVREYPSAVIANVFLFGDEELIGSWHRQLAGHLQYPVELGTRLVEGLGLAFGSAVGLLGVGQGRSEASLDFLKRSQISTQAVPRASAGVPIDLASAFRGPPLVMGAGLAGAVVLACWALGTQQVSSARHRLDQLVSARPSVGWGVEGMGQNALKPVKEKANQQLELLKRIIDGRSAVAAQLDALARSLPDGVWLTGVEFENTMDQTAKSQARLAVKGACFLGASGQELRTIQEFEARVKRSPALASGFATTQLEQIQAQVDGRQQYSFRTFQLSCESGRKL